MQSQLRLNAHGELGDNAKRVPATTAQRPEQVGVLALVGGAEPAVGGHHFDLHDPVDSQAVYRRQEAVAAALQRNRRQTPSAEQK